MGGVLLKVVDGDRPESEGRAERVTLLAQRSEIVAPGFAGLIIHQLHLPLLKSKRPSRPLNYIIVRRTSLKEREIGK